MSKKTFSFWLIWILVKIGLVPGGSSRCRDWLGLWAWMVIVTVASVFYVYQFIISDMVAFDIPGLMMLLGMAIMPAIQMFGVVLALSPTSTKVPDLVQTKNVPLPYMWPFFCLVTISWAFMLSNFIRQPSLNVFFVAFLLSLIIYSLLYWTNIFIIGVSIGQFCDKLDKRDLILNVDSAHQIVTALVKDCKALISYLSPMLMVLISVQTCIIIVTSYSLFSCKVQRVATELACATLSLLYICVIIDNCCSKIKSVSEKLRLFLPSYLII